MVERAKNLYQKIKSNLEDQAVRKELYIAGETLVYGSEPLYPYILEETVSFFVAQQPDSNFDPPKTYNFLNNLILDIGNSILIHPHQELLLLSAGGTTSRLILGSLMFFEKLETYEDLLDLPCYTDKIRNLPALNRFHSSRGIIIRSYPSREYADQIYSYQRSLVLGEESNPLMDWLAHSVSEEQIRVIDEAGGFLILRNLPQPPLIDKGFRGQGN